MTELSAGARGVILSFADDEHLIGQRHSEWIGVAPFLEEDLTVAGIGRDELVHAAELYGLVVGDDDEAVDRLAFRRPANEYRSCWLVEYETNDWAEALVRHWYYDAAEQLRWELLADSAVPELADLAQRAGQDESFHRRHADGLLDALLDVDEARRRIEYAAAVLWPLAVAMFDPVDREGEAIASGMVASSWAGQLPVWRNLVVRRFGSIDWDSVDDGGCAVQQRNRTIRHPHFDAVYGRMRAVMRYDPLAVW